jgi:hypothetical protein
MLSAVGDGVVLTNKALVEVNLGANPMVRWAGRLQGAS